MNAPMTVLLDAPGEPRARIQIARLGKVKDPRYGEFEITAGNVASWRKNLAHLPGGRSLIDFEHRSEKSPRNSEAAGWITGIDLDGDKVMADAEWTDKGSEAIKNKRYLFLSPAYGKYRDEHGATYEDTLCSTALTNKPVLGSLPMLTLASEERVTAALDGDPAARFYQRAIAGGLGDAARALVLLDVSAAEREQAVKDDQALPDGTYPIRNAEELHSAAVLAASGHGDAPAAKKLVRRRASELGVSLSHLPGFNSDGTDQRTMDAEPLIKTLGLDEDADDVKILDAVTALGAAPVKTLDEQAHAAGMVMLTRDAYSAMAAELVDGKQAADALHAERRDRAWTRALEQMVRVPAQKDRFDRLFELDAEGTVADVEADISANRRLLNSKPIGAEGDLQEPKTLEDRINEIKTEKGIGYDKAYLIALDEMEGRAG